MNQSERLLLSCCGRHRQSPAGMPSSAKSVKHNHKSRTVNEIQMHTTDKAILLAVQLSDNDNEDMMMIDIR